MPSETGLYKGKRGGDVETISFDRLQHGCFDGRPRNMGAFEFTYCEHAVARGVQAFE